MKLTKIIITAFVTLGLTSVSFANEDFSTQQEQSLNVISESLLINPAYQGIEADQKEFKITYKGKVYYTNDWESFASCLKGIGKTATCAGAAGLAEVFTSGVSGGLTAVGTFLICASTAVKDLGKCVSK
jgi:hypothetical protein